MEKTINLEESIYQLTEKYPEIIDIMSSLGFTEIQKKAIRLSVGKMMTIPKGASMKGIDLATVVSTLSDNGFTIVGAEPTKAKAAPSQPTHPTTTATSHPTAIATQIKDYLRRLNQGEDMESVRADFVKHFRTVKGTEIMKAEQELISEGESVKTVKKLCDVHSALFHGSLHHDQERMMIGQAGESRDKTEELKAIDGHPVQTLYRENEAIVRVLDSVEARLADGGDVAQALSAARGLAVHYAKKGDLVYPLLKVRYGIYGPSQVMWTLDDEIRAELATLAKQATTDEAQDEAWRERVAAVVKRAREMTFKENRILFPVCAANFSDDDWLQLYADSKGYETCLGVEGARWEAGEQRYAQLHHADTTGETEDDGLIRMPGGTLTVAQLTALLDTLPMEITFVDADNINRYFSQPFSSKAFKRPLSALGREVFSCHPPKVEPMVRAIIQDFRDGKRDKVPVWLEKNGHTMLITYMAVRDANGNYIGTMETVQDMEGLKRRGQTAY